MNKQTLRKYFGHIDFTETNNSHTQAFFFLREHSASSGIAHPRVLEVGCSIGYFSHALRENGVYVHGVEPFSREAADLGRVDEFFHGTVEDFLREVEPKHLQSFDAVILGDILEHLPQPEKTLVELSRFLKPDGVFIASVPNITHIGIIRMMSHGEWMYEKYGLLDSTHIRFFSWRSVREMFIRAGFGIERRYDVLVPELQVYASAEAVACQAQALNPNDHAFQFVVRASRKSLPDEAFVDSLPRNILVVSPGPSMPLTKLRLLEPLSAYLAEVGGSLRVAYHCPPEQLRWADVLVTHRELLPETLDLIRHARNLGLAVVYDIDDLLTQFFSWSNAPTTRIDKMVMEKVIATADRVTCTTQRLGDELRKHTDNIAIVPNVITQPDTETSLSVCHSGSTCTLIVASSDSVITDFLIEPVRILCTRMPELDLVTIGPISGAFAGLTPRIRQYEQCPPEEFSEILLGIENGIGLIPLDDSLFSSCKSPIKFFHYTACGVVTVASAVPPYTDVMEDGVNGLLVSNALDAWCRAILRLVKDDKLRQLLLARAIRTWQMKGSKKVAVKAWKEAFKGLPKSAVKRACPVMGV